MERQAKDGTVYKQVGDDQWTPVTRQAKDGTVYKKVGDDQWSPIQPPQQMQQPSAIEDGVRAGAEGLAESATVGLLPYLKAGASQATEFISDAINGSDTGGEGDLSYDQWVDHYKDQGKALQAKNPIAAGTGQLAGFFVPGVGATKLVKGAVGVGAKLGSKTAQALAKSGRAKKLYKAAAKAKEAGNIKRAKFLLGGARKDLLKQGVQLGAEGAVLGFVYTPESGFTDVGSRAESAALGFGTGQVMPAGLRGMGNVARGIGNGARKTLGSLGGVSDDVVKRYLENPERIRSAQSFDELYEEVSGIVGRLGDDLDNSKLDYDAAKNHLDEIAAGIKQSRIEGKEKAYEQVVQARAMLDETYNSAKNNVQRRANPTSLHGPVEDAINNQKKRVSAGSGEARNILQHETGSFSKDSILNNLKKQSLELTDRASDAAQGAKKKIDKIIGVINKRGDELSMPEVKRLIQDIDDDIGNWTKGTGSFDDQYTINLKQARRYLDSRLKDASPMYKEAMGVVADDTVLLKESSQRFGRGNPIARMSNLARPAAKQDVETLRALAKQNGGTLPKQVDDLIDAQKTLKSPTRLQNMKQALPESKTLRDAEARFAANKRLAKPKNIKETIEKSSAKRSLLSQKAQMNQAKKVFNSVKAFGEGSAESKLKQVASGKKWARKQLSELSKLSDKDFVKAVDAASDAAAFDKTAFNGSRNVNLWTVLGSFATGRGGVGSAGGFIFGGPMGMAVGAVAGAMVDRYGPKMTKKILDAVIKIKGPISKSAINNMDIPVSIRAELAERFKSTILTERAASRAGNSLVADKKKPKTNMTSQSYRRPN